MGFLDDLMSAITFAEAGEHETARAILKEGSKTVLLAVSDREFDGNALKYALNIANRIKANLEVLYVSESDKERSRIRDFISAVKKVGFRFSLVVKKGCMKKAILDYTERRRDILFVVVGSAMELNIGCEKGKKDYSEAWDKLGCPLVVVSKADATSAA